MNKEDILYALPIILIIILIGIMIWNDFNKAYQECVEIYGNCTVWT